MRRSTAATVVAAALRVRTQLGLGLNSPVCPIEVAVALGLQVRFMAVPSLEGMYSPGPPAIMIIGSERPPGRRNFSAAHEIGHHVFGHGERIDEEDAHRHIRSQEEQIADRFAGALLMPKVCVGKSFSVRGIQPADATPADLYVVAREVGVGFTTLIGQMESVLQMLPRDRAEALRRQRLPKVRKELAGCKVERDLIVADRAWRRGTVDLEVGDLLLLPDGGDVEGASVSVRQPGRLAEAVRAGASELRLPGRSDAVSVRVARRRFEGLSRWKFLEDPDDE